MKTKMPQTNGGLFGASQAFFGGIKSQGKGTLHVLLVVFSAGFPRDSGTIVELIVKDNALRNRLTSFFNSVIYSSASQEEDVTCPKCDNPGTLIPVKIQNCACTGQSKWVDPYNTSTCTLCKSQFGEDEALRYSV